MTLNMAIVKAIFRRDVRRYFTSPTGYVFITLFIFLSAVSAFWQERFFLNNLANLDQLNDNFHYLLLFFIPALTMGIWADENKQGTDELMLTLPATDLEVSLGKYLAALGVYSASILLSLSHVLVLFWLGNPDVGLMLGNYFGYWIAGGALIAVGMLASLLTDNATIAFVLGAVFCGLLIFVADIFGVFGSAAYTLFEALGIVPHFRDFARGIISSGGVLYFLALTVFFLYLNVVLIGRRHWPPQADGYKMWVHHSVRAAALAIALISLTTLLGRAGIRLDVTAEGMHSLADETESLLDELDSERPVFIQAFISPEVPEQFVQTRANLISFLNEIDAAAGSKVQVVIKDTEAYSEEAREARTKFGINPRQVNQPGTAGTGPSEVFMGLAFTCGAEEEVIPFFERGYPAEYELARSIRVVARTERKKIGVVKTEAKLFGGFDFQSMQSTPSWNVVAELEKQYEVVEISADQPITEEVDGLMVALPSSLSQPEMDNLKATVKAGTPALLLVDPVPIVNPGLAPRERAGANKNPFMRNQGPPPTEKGDIQTFLSDLGVSWSPAQIVWDAYNPHPELSGVPPEVVFIGAGNENPEAFNPAHAASSGLQEVVMIYPGFLNPGVGSSANFTPLLSTGYVSGVHDYRNVVQRSFFGTQINQRLPHNNPTGVDYAIAAQVRALQAGESGEGEAEAQEGENAHSAKGANIIVIADLDFISEQFFELRRLGIENLEFDNVTFFLNCMDMLVGDESFVELRKKRVRHRTLELVEGEIREFRERSLKDEAEAEARAQVELEQAQQRLDQRIAEVRQRSDLDERTKQIMERNLQEVENQRFEARKAEIEERKNQTIASSKETMKTQIHSIQRTIKSIAIVIPPIPVFIIGVMIFIRRRKREKEGTAMARRLRS